MAELAWLKREDEVFDGPGLIVEIDVLDPPAGDAIGGDNARLIEVSNGSEHGDWTERSQSLFNPNSEIGKHDLLQSLGGKAFCRSSTYRFR